MTLRAPVLRAHGRVPRARAGLFALLLATASGFVAWREAHSAGGTASGERATSRELSRMAAQRRGDVLHFTRRIAAAERGEALEFELSVDEPAWAGMSFETQETSAAPEGALAPTFSRLPRGRFDGGGEARLRVGLDPAWSEAVGAGLHTRALDVVANDGGAETTLARLELHLVVEPSKSLGVNLAYVDYFSSLLVYRDLFRQASRWIPQEVEGYTWDTKAPLELDEQGWVARLAPGQAAAVLLARDIDGHYPGGEWTLRWEGRGKLEARLDAKLVRQSKGKATLRVTPSGAGVHLRLVETDPEDPLRELRVYPPDQARADGLFRDDALALLEPFAAIRFMDWQRTNDSTLVRWEDRPLATDARQSGPHGVALEHVVALANELEADPWVCIPHRADDAFVRAFCELLRDQLDARRRVYLEYSNEVWNGIFQQAGYARDQGLALGLSDDPFQAQMRYYAQRSCEVFAIASEVFEDRPARLVRVLAGPSVNAWAGEQLLDWQDAWRHADAYAIAPYFGHPLGEAKTAAEVRALGPEALVERLGKEMERVMDGAARHAELAREHGLAFLAYEGGQHMVGLGPAVDDEALTRAFQAANRHPSMGALYTRSLDAWREAGGGLFFAWNAVERWSKWGSWGAAEYMDQTPAEAPKYEALRRWSLDVEPWW